MAKCDICQLSRVFVILKNCYYQNYFLLSLILFYLLSIYFFQKMSINVGLCMCIPSLFCIASVPISMQTLFILPFQSSILIHARRYGTKRNRLFLFPFLLSHTSPFGTNGSESSCFYFSLMMIWMYNRSVFYFYFQQKLMFASDIKNYPTTRKSL